MLPSLLADRLTTGSVPGLDRSATMTTAAVRRNTAVARGAATVRTAELLDAGLDAGWADLVIAALAGPHGLRVAARHLGDTPPRPSIAVELRR